MTLPNHTTFDNTGELNKLLFFNETKIINLKYIAYIHIAPFLAVREAWEVRIVMNDGFIHDFPFNTMDDARQLISDIQHSIMYEKTHNIIEIDYKIKSLEEANA